MAATAVAPSSFMNYKTAWQWHTPDNSAVALIGFDENSGRLAIVWRQRQFVGDTMYVYYNVTAAAFAQLLASSSPGRWLQQSLSIPAAERMAVAGTPLEILLEGLPPAGDEEEWLLATEQQPIPRPLPTWFDEADQLDPAACDGQEHVWFILRENITSDRWQLWHVTKYGRTAGVIGWLWQQLRAVA